MGFESAKYFLSFTRRPVRHFDRIVQTLVGAMIRARCQFTDGLDVTAQLVGDHDPWFAEQGDQSLEEPLCGLCVSACLHENIEHVAICVDRAPQPMFLAVDRDDNFIEVPLVVGSRTVPTDALSEVLTKAVKNEVDIVLENRRGQIVGIEVKSSATVSGSDFSGMRKLAEACREKLIQGMVL